MNATIEMLARIYPRQIWLDLSLAESAIELPQTERERHDFTLSQVDLDRLCLAPVKAWLDRTIELKVEDIFPCWLAGTDRLKFISKLVNGFNLQIGETKVVFIPSEAIDIAEFAVPQEWVDLPNWAADYYVPVRVDLANHCLQLWGFISHQDLKAQAQFDRVFRNYHVAAEDTTEELDLLVATCQLQAAGASISTQARLAPLAELAAPALEQALQQLQSHHLRLSPRLNLDFDYWSNILNNANYLTKYLTRWRSLSVGVDGASALAEAAPLELRESTQQLIKIADLVSNLTSEIGRGWQTIETFLNPPKLTLATHNFRSHLRQVMNQKIYRGMPLETPAQIQTAIEQLYHAQTEIPLPARINGVEDLCILMEKSTNETIRWKAIEYLWIIDPDHPKLPLRYIRDLGIQFATDSLALMIAELPMSESRRAILLRVYPVNREIYLPTGVKLSIFDEDGAIVFLSPGNPFEAVSRNVPQDNYIQLYFVADESDRFGVNVILNGQQFTEYFIA